MNVYEQAIWNVGRILEPYDFNRMFPFFGFGAKPRFAGGTEVSHCFNMNGQVNPEVLGMEGMFAAYKNAVANIGLYGPTYFQHILTAHLNFIKGTLQTPIYHVLLIITDGDIHDMP